MKEKCHIFLVCNWNEILLNSSYNHTSELQISVTLEDFPMSPSN